MIPNQQKQRLLSLDILRGFLVFSMIIVNSPGFEKDPFSIFQHADWNGWSFADLIFPGFLFVAGMAIFLHTKQPKLQHILWKTLILFASGLFLNVFPYCEGIRILGILQRIAICYLICNICFYNCKLNWLIFWYIFFMSIYWIAALTYPVPFYGTGILEKEGNLAWYIDSHLLANHTWFGATFMGYPNGFDPEGILTTLPSISNMLFGIIAGHLLKFKKNINWLFLTGISLTLAGLVIDYFMPNMPINRNIWSPTFTILTSGTSLLFFACFYWLIDYKKYHRFSEPLRILGINSLLIFIISVSIVNLLTFLGIKYYFYNYILLQYIPNPALASLIYSSIIVLTMYYIASKIKYRSFG